MSRMGGSCSLQRQRALWQKQQNQSGHDDEGTGSEGGSSVDNTHDSSTSNRRSLRHSVDSEVPDNSIASLYPPQENFTPLPNNYRTPKSLVSLCIEQLCRSLPDLDGELPPGLPQDIVDKIVKSLESHSALNATTLRVLRNCELGQLSLAGCRGVRDEWLTPLSSRVGDEGMIEPTNSIESLGYSNSELFLDPMDLDVQQQQQNYAQHRKSEGSNDDPALKSCPSHENEPQEQVMYTRESEDSSSCSTSSFVSASSTPYYNTSGKMSPTDQRQRCSSPSQNNNNSSSSSLPFSEIISHSPKQQQQQHHSTPPHLAPPTSPKIIHSTLSTPTPSTTYLTLLDLRNSQKLTDRGLLQLGTKLQNLEVVRLDNCHSIVGSGLKALSSSHRLHTLSMANCRRVTDEAIINISHLSNLNALVLDGCRCLTDRALHSMSSLYRLRQLDLSQCDLITNEGLDSIHDLSSLSELSLGWCRLITDVGLEILSLQPGRDEVLKVLRLSRCSITDVGVEQFLSRLRGLEELDLNGCVGVGGVALGKCLEKLEKLESLDVSYCPGILRAPWQNKINSLKTLELCYSSVRDIHLSRLTSLPSLLELNLDSCPISDWAIAHLADNNVVPNLTSLDLADTDLSDMGMVHLPKFKKMTRLSLFYCNISNGGLRHLSGMKSLEVLNLDSRDVSDEGLSHLKNLPNLKALDLFSGRITDHGCIHLSTISSLESLELCGGGIGDLGCAHLGKLDNLTSLNLSQNERITNRGVASLGALMNLKALNLSNTRVDAEGIRYLGGLVKLQSLALYGCKGLEDGVQGLNDLQGELPSLRCLRLNGGESEDGIVEVQDNGEDDDDDDDIEEETEEMLGEDENEDEDDVIVAVAHQHRRIRMEPSHQDTDDDDADFDLGEIDDSDDEGDVVRMVEVADDDDDDDDDEENPFSGHDQRYQNQSVDEDDTSFFSDQE